MCFVAYPNAPFGVFVLYRELREALVALNDPDAWTPADADAFWKSAEKARFN